jgi:hypothetical protein
VPGEYKIKKLALSGTRHAPVSPLPDPLEKKMGPPPMGKKLFGSLNRKFSRKIFHRDESKNHHYTEKGRS